MNRLAKLWADRTSTVEPDWESLKAASSHPELIGRMPDDVVPPFGRESPTAPMYFLHCGCGMLMGTSKDYSGCEAVCMHCQSVASNPSAAPQSRGGQMSPRTERQVRFGLIAFVLLGAIMLGMSVSNGGSRPEPTMRALD